MSKNNKAEKTELAWQAIDYLVEHDLVIKWTFPETDPPSEEIRKLIAPYFSDGEIEMTAAWLLSDFLIERLENDCLLITDSQLSQDPHRPRVVCGDDD